MFDLADIKISLDAMECEIRHPQTAEVLKNAEGEPFVIHVYGHDSEQYKKHARKLLDLRLKGKKKDLGANEIEAEAIELLISLTVGWSGIVFDKKPLVFSTAAARDLYGNPAYAWLKEQVEAFVQDRSNFLPKSPES